MKPNPTIEGLYRVTIEGGYHLGDFREWRDGIWWLISGGRPFSEVIDWQGPLVVAGEETPAETALRLWDEAQPFGGTVVSDPRRKPAWLAEVEALVRERDKLQVSGERLIEWARETLNYPGKRALRDELLKIMEGRDDG